MGFLRYLPVIAVTVLLTLGCVYGFSRISCEGTETGEAGAEALSVRLLSEDGGAETEDVQSDVETDEETAEVKQWVRVTFDAVVIALSIGVIVLAVWAVKRVMRKYGGSGRCFG